MSLPTGSGWNSLYTRQGREILTGGLMVLVFLGVFSTTVASCHQTNADRHDRQMMRQEQQVSQCLSHEISPDECYRLIHGHYPSKDHIDG